MRRAIWLLAGVLLSAVVLGSDSPKEYDDRTETVGIEGTWRLTESERNGKKTEPNREIVHTYRSGIYTIDDGDGNPWRGSFRNDSARKPAHLDWHPSNGPYKGQTTKLIYKIDGDTLKIAILTNGAWSRPPAFNGNGVEVWTYKRVK